MNTVIGIRMACQGERRVKGVKRWQEVEVPIPTGRPCPLSVCIGTPFTVTKTSPRVVLEDPAALVNQHATWLNIELDSGFAPLEWQMNVGPVIVARTDGKNMTTDDLDHAIDVAYNVLDKFGDGEPFDVKAFIAKAANDRQGW